MCRTASKSVCGLDTYQLQRQAKNTGLRWFRVPLKTLISQMPSPIKAAQFDDLLLHQRPMFDVRAPIEFDKGAFPNVVNLPLMNDDERQQVGTCYKLKGQEAAMALGQQLVNGETKAKRVEKWQAFATDHPDAVLFCFRGGLRSQISQQWLAEAGIAIPFVEGGYKALRTHLIERLDDLVDQRSPFYRV